jgi:hypothetical protein
MNQFIYAKELLLYAQDAIESKTPWDKWQVRVKGDDHRWVDALGPIRFHEGQEYRRKPPTFSIRGAEVEWEPVSFEEWTAGATCYTPDISIGGGGYVTCNVHTNPHYVENRAKQGLLCRTREQAIAFANAITKGYYKND